jgi:hypothetical protein
MYILVLIGLDLFLPLLQDDGELNAVVIPPITSLVPEGVQLELLRTINPLGPSSNYGGPLKNLFSVN